MNAAGVTEPVMKARYGAQLDRPVGIVELCERAHQLSVEHEFAHTFRIEARTLEMLRRRSELYNSAPAELRDTKLLSLFGQKISRPFIYCAQPLSRSGIMCENELGFPEETLSQSLSHQYINQLGLQILDPSCDYFNYLLHTPLEGETEADIHRMIVQADYSLILHSSAVLMDATVSFSIGATLELAFANYVGVPAIAAIRDDQTPSVWLCHYATEVIPVSTSYIDSMSLYPLAARLLSITLETGGTEKEGGTETCTESNSDTPIVLFPSLSQHWGALKKRFDW